MNEIAISSWYPNFVQIPSASPSAIKKDIPDTATETASTPCNAKLLPIPRRRKLRSVAPFQNLQHLLALMWETVETALPSFLAIQWNIMGLAVLVCLP